MTIKIYFNGKLENVPRQQFLLFYSLIRKKFLFLFRLFNKECAFQVLMTFKPNLLLQYHFLLSYRFLPIIRIQAAGAAASGGMPTKPSPRPLPPVPPGGPPAAPKPGKRCTPST